MVKEIDRDLYDKLGGQIQEWCEEQGFETSIEMDCDLINRVCNTLGIKRVR
jgi:hypothetical protein